MHIHDTFGGRRVDGDPGVPSFREGVDGDLAQVAFVDQGLEGRGGMPLVVTILVEDVAQDGQIGAEHGFPGVEMGAVAARRQNGGNEEREEEGGRGQDGAARYVHVPSTCAGAAAFIFTRAEAGAPILHPARAME